MSIVEIRQKKGGLVVRAKAILDTAQNEGRGMTPAEKKKYDALYAGILDLQAEDDRYTRQQALEIRALETDDSGARNYPESQETETENMPQRKNEILYDMEKGKEVRVYRANESWLEGRSYPSYEGNPSDFSLGKFFRGCVTGDWSNASLEKRTAMEAGSPTLGGYLVPTAVSDVVIDKLRNKLAVNQAGARSVEMESDSMTMARLNTAPVSYYVGEGASATEASAAFDAINMKTVKLVCMLPATKELMYSASNAPGLIEDQIAKSLAEKVDYGVLEGVGGSEVTGIYNTDGVSTNAVGAALTLHDELAASYFSLLALNVEPRNISALWNAQVARILGSMTNNATDYVPYENIAAPWYKDMRKIVTNQITGTSPTKIFYGDFSQIIIGYQRRLELEVSKDYQFDKSLFTFKGTVMFDVAVIQPSAFRVDYTINAT